MPPETLTEPPDEPHHKSEPHLLSPASPKPIHFPAPANIPVLENMMDVGFNQTEAHMNDPAMRNTEVRPDFWRDANDQHASPGEASQSTAARHDTVDASSNTRTAVVHPDHSLQSSLGDADAQPDVAAAPVDMPILEASEAVPPTEGPSLELHANPAQISDTVLEDVQQAVSNGQVNMQALFHSLQSAPMVPGGNAAPSNDGTTGPSTNAASGNAQSQVPVDELSSTSASGLGAPPSGLPPRPPPQETPLINQNYVHSQHIRDYHPHAAHSAYNPSSGNASQGNVAEPSLRNYVPPVPTPLSPSSQGQDQYQPSPIVTTQSPGGSRLPVTPQVDTRRETRASGKDSPPSEEKPWTGETQRKYDRFLEEERKYVSEGRWEQFPMGSRLFIGNLSSEKVTKRDVFHVFHHYGSLAQISIKQAYGFVQFLNPDAAAKALGLEQGRHIKDKKIHLEISKPQKNRTQANARRSRSPDYHKGARPMTTDRFVPDRSGDRDRVGRDDYRPTYRSPSPRGYRDRRSDRHRSRSPPDYHRSSRYRSPSPRRSDTDDLPLPRREPQAVPEIQIIVLGPLDRDFIAWVEKAFSSRGVSIDVLILSPRLSEQAVIRRQILEGVLAVSRLTRANQDSGKIPLQIFDRSAGSENVKFEEYDNLDPHIAVELVLRARSTQQNARTSGYGSMSGYGAQYGSQQQYGTGYNAPQPSYQQYTTPGGFPPTSFTAPPTQVPPSAGPAPPHLQNIITSLDPGSLQSLLSAMKTPQTATTAFGTPLQTPASAYSHAQAASYPPSALPQNLGQQQQAALAAVQHNPQAFAGYLQQHPPPPALQGGQPQTGAPVNMQDILARLGTYGKPA